MLVVVGKKTDMDRPRANLTTFANCGCHVWVMMIALVTSCVLFLKEHVTLQKAEPAQNIRFIGRQLYFISKKGSFRLVRLKLAGDFFIFVGVCPISWVVMYEDI